MENQHSTKTNKNIERSELILPSVNFDKTFEFFTEKFGFQINSIFPADNPAVAVISGFGLRLRLEKVDENPKVNENITLRFDCNSPKDFADGQTEFTAPNGVKIELVEANPPLVLPEMKSSFVLNKLDENADWITGRAGMRYRDLIPDRQGGRFIASHIHIPKGGKVPDYVHFHKIHFQMIYCYKGWAKLVYEDQGEPFIFNAGDCVLQPPQIRHRVLECSDNLEVIEVSCPAEHETIADNGMTLPTDSKDDLREFSGQRFVHHIAKDNFHDRSWRFGGFDCRTTGINYATNGLADVKIVRHSSYIIYEMIEHNAAFVFFFILQGGAELRRENNKIDPLEIGDSLVIPAGMKYMFAECSRDFEMLEVTLPAEHYFKEL